MKLKLLTLCLIALSGASTIVMIGDADARTRRPAAHSCGGTERWNVKVANDPDATAIDTASPPPTTVSALNAILPGLIDAGGRMDVEKKEYTVQGYLSFFKSETDGDYHVVITDAPGDYTHGPGAPNGRSMVVEFPNPRCFAGHNGRGRRTSVLRSQISQARAAFEEGVSGIDGRHIQDPIKVTVTGVGFFDFDHGQTGRAQPHPGVDGQRKVFELHPVTAISFDQ